MIISLIVQQLELALKGKYIENFKTQLLSDISNYFKKSHLGFTSLMIYLVSVLLDYDILALTDYSNDAVS